MFTGLIEEIGQIRSIENFGDGSRLHINATKILDDINLGDSIAVNGVCLTVVSHSDNSFSVEAVKETMTRSALSELKIHQNVNLERALKANSRLGGHFVQGHVDGIGTVLAMDKQDPGYLLKIKLPADLSRFLVEKGSIAINGISLTLASVDNDRISLAIIPHTVQATTLHALKSGDSVNIEVDVLGKYIYKMVGPFAQQSGITLEKLKDFGFD